MATDAEQVDEVASWFAEKGFRLAVEKRDMRADVPRDAPSHGRAYWVDLINLHTGHMDQSGYGSGPSEILAIIAAEQRWLVEQEGEGSAPGKTYVTMAEERLRRGRQGS